MPSKEDNFDKLSTASPNRGPQKDPNAAMASDIANYTHSKMIPAIISDDSTYRLQELVQSGFKMPETDKDFELTHE